MQTNIVEMAIDDVIVKDRPRKDDGDLGTLEASIQKLGLLCPIIVDANNVLITGGRRLQACRNIGRKKVSVCRLGIEAGSMKALDIQADENLCRQSLTSEEIEAHIEIKKRAVSGRSVPGAGLVNGIKKVFGTSN
ncbi:MAG: ParB N-terminal domain-containing protein [Kiritimatiellia bacterium]|jgi:ParB family chromosome partitioning protein|nr:ParB N-terminal domain-containing protein [Kiritimatiellia bacterium]MDP6847729.1 ParB N-terminal domain-containing protein [Kiritimatiellia bacterium]